MHLSTFCLLVLPLVAGCAYQYPYKKSVPSNLLSTNDPTPKPFHAELHDIPVPVGFELTATTTNSQIDNSTCSHYQFSGEQSLDQLVLFYKAHMEDQGWKVDSFIASESLLVCKKPSKRCTISLRSHNTKKNCTNISLLVKLPRAHDASEKTPPSYLLNDELAS